MTNIVPIHTVTSDYQCLHDILQKFFTLFATTNKEEKKLMPQTDPFLGRDIAGIKTQPNCSLDDGIAVEPLFTIT